MEAASDSGDTRRKRALPASALPCAWAAIIFATSCRFIDRDAFIRFVSRFLPGAVLQHSWAALWMVCGLLIVKGYHVAEFTLLCLFTYSALRRLTPWPAKKALAVSAGLCLLYAASDEWHQTFVPGRGGHVADVLIDSLGITLTMIWMRRQLAGRHTYRET